MKIFYCQNKTRTPQFCSRWILHARRGDRPFQTRHFHLGLAFCSKMESKLLFPYWPKQNLTFLHQSTIWLYNKLKDIFSIVTVWLLLHYSGRYTEACKARFEFLHVPPTAPDMMRNVLSLLNSSAKNKRKVLVHCASVRPFSRVRLSILHVLLKLRPLVVAMMLSFVI